MDPPGNAPLAPPALAQAPGVPPPRLQSDPSLEVCPNFSSPLYNAIVQAFALSQGIVPNVATQQLTDVWTAENDSRKLAWATQCQADQDAEDAAEAQHLAAEDAAKRADEELAEAECREVEKKKPKIGDFDEDVAPPDVLLARLSVYALEKLRKCEYIGLWYFTEEGCQDAHDSQSFTIDEAFSIAHLDNMMALKPMASCHASRNALQDHDLSWRQMTMGKAVFLIEIQKAGWPQKHRDSLLAFFYAITNHEF
ncbi:predicted protein [Sparassis crispa]|uniref:Uncharacterized protein n=1 Tax=Sparassis crispa TaxID=139825 RepID=A0A401GQE3_9APHY|nr:predicted protein [Sparassis crispa]GBE84443.1 predicted protein [Sparassis crispa]